MLSGVVVFLPGLQMSSVSTPGPQLAPHQGVSKPAADTILKKKAQSQVKKSWLNIRSYNQEPDLNLGEPVLLLLCYLQQ